MALSINSLSLGRYNSMFKQVFIQPGLVTDIKSILDRD